MLGSRRPSPVARGPSPDEYIGSTTRFRDPLLPVEKLRCANIRAHRLLASFGSCGLTDCRYRGWPLRVYRVTEVEHRVLRRSPEFFRAIYMVGHPNEFPCVTNGTSRDRNRRIVSGW
jgi:hypothetical protein